jgi:hypothetical protein
MTVLVFTMKKKDQRGGNIVEESLFDLRRVPEPEQSRQGRQQRSRAASAAGNPNHSITGARTRQDESGSLFHMPFKASS